MPHLLFVCAANRARSPLAELVARALLDTHPGGADLTVGSAGTWTPGDEPMWEPAAEAATALGLDPTPVRSRPITPAAVDESHLVLTATGELRDAVIAMRPAALGKVFTWRELAWTFGTVVPAWGEMPLVDRPAQVPGFVTHYRGQVTLPAGDDLDVADPAGRGPQVMSDATTLTVDAVRTIVEGLCR